MIAKNIYRLGSSSANDVATSAIPGADPEHGTSADTARRPRKRVPVTSLVQNALPAADELLALVEDYFQSVHWFSLVVLEPRFRPMFEAVKDGSAYPYERHFLLLLSTMLGLAAWYRSHQAESTAFSKQEYWRRWSHKLIANAESQLTLLLSDSSVVTIQILTLLGSFYVYQGRPALSFSLLGATVKAAQAARLHQENKSVSELLAEERRRLWWTIYTWDRFASITYGRPLGINDKDCNVAMPGDVYENTSFHSLLSNDPQPTSKCLSAYQRNLNGLYVIASPAIERLYSARESENPKAAEDYIAMLTSMTAELWHWRQRLPVELTLDLEHDYSPTASASERAHRLQALSLHLTFESLQIILHRPFLKEQLRLMRSNMPSCSPISLSGDTGTQESAHGVATSVDASNEPAAAPTSSPREWWEAAVRTVRVTELPEMMKVATDTHLVSFLALNLFNAAIVMIVLALSDPLNNRAQQTKRAVARIHRLHTTLGSRSTLSQQSSQVLRTLIELLLRRECEAILEPPSAEDTILDRGDAVLHNSARVAGPDSTVNWNLGTRATSGSIEHNQQSQAVPTGSNAALANRIDLSLASVQQVFTTAPHNRREPFGNDVFEGIQGHPSDDLSFGNAQEFGSGSYLDDPANFEQWTDENYNISDGIGWFWDPSWDHMG